MKSGNFIGTKALLQRLLLILVGNDLSFTRRGDGAGTHL